MPRIESLNILLENTGKDYLAELYGKVIENLQKNALSVGMKNMDLSGDPAAGTVEAKRFANATSQTYGTARAAGAGGYVTARPVTVAINTDKEIVEEIEEKDIKLYGVDGLLQRRSANHTQRMVAELDRAFFACAATAATVVAATGNIEEMLEALIQAAEMTSNDFVDGVDRSMMNLVLTPAYYGRIRNQIDLAANANVDTGAEEIKLWHGVKVASCTRLPVGTNALLIVDGAVAQPVTSNGYTAEKIGLSEAYAVSLFFHYGTTAVMPDLIYTLGDTEIGGAVYNVTAPVKAATPQSTHASGTGYTAEIAWAPEAATFAASTAYTATVTYTAADGFTFEGGFGKTDIQGLPATGASGTATSVTVTRVSGKTVTAVVKYKATEA